MRRGASATQVAVTGASTQKILGGRGFLCGWSLSETAAAATVAQILDGEQAGSPALTGGIVLPASGASIVPLHWPVEFQRGLFISNTAGAITGALWVMLVPDYFDDEFLQSALNLPVL